MRKPLLTATLLLLAATATMADEPVGQTPQTGYSYYIYNVGQQQYLAATSGLLTLGASQTAVTVASAQDAAASLGFVALSAGGQSLGADLWLAPTASGDSQYQDWAVQPVGGQEGVYRLALRQRETNAGQYLCHSTAHAGLAFTAQQPDAAFADGLWKFVSTEPTAIAAAEVAPASPATYDVYTLSGQCVRSHAASADGLGHGVFIVNGRKVVK